MSDGKGCLAAVCVHSHVSKMLACFQGRLGQGPGVAPAMCPHTAVGNSGVDDHHDGQNVKFWGTHVTTQTD